VSNELQRKEIIYVGDPMCSWCWGFSPVFQQLRDTFADRVDFQLKVGGLRSGTKTTMDSKFRAFLRHHWDDVRKSTGQMFNFALLEKNDFIYDTEPACRAAWCVNQIETDKAFSFFQMLQQSFYIGNLDITQPGTLTQLAEKAGVHADEFEKKFNSRAAVVNTYEEFIAVRKLGVQGFPSLLWQKGQMSDFLTRGYKPYDVLVRSIEEWLGRS
jgi:putative protein-disulfide isomerase